MSGLPINTFQQADEFRKQYMYYLALEAQNNELNMRANRVFRETGQPIRPPDTRTTTEKMADLEEVKVRLLERMKTIMDSTSALEAISALTPGEIQFVYQQFDAIQNELKPRFSQGVPTVAFMSFIRALITKEMATSGVSFPAQEATAQSLLSALAAGRAAGAPIAPFGPSTSGAPGGISPGGAPGGISPGGASPGGAPSGGPYVSYSPGGTMSTSFSAPPTWALSTSPMPPSTYAPPSGTYPVYPGTPAFTTAPGTRAPTPDPYTLVPYAPGVTFDPTTTIIQPTTDPGLLMPIDPSLPSGTPSANQIDTTLPILHPVSVNPDPIFTDMASFDKAKWDHIRAWYERISSHVPPTMKQELIDANILNNNVGSQYYGKLRKELGNKKFNMDVPTAKNKLRDLFELSLYHGWDKPLSVTATSANPTSGVLRADTLDEAKRKLRPIGKPVPAPAHPKGDPTAPTSGSGFRRTVVYPGMRQRLDHQPIYHGAIRAPIQGFGIGKRTQSKPTVSVDISKGIARTVPTFIPFGKYIVDPAKLSRGLLDLRTLNGGKVVKYPLRELSEPLTKLMKRILEDRMPDEYDMQTLDLDDQHMLFNLAKDACINDRLQIPTPKLSKNDQLMNRFEILKGQIIAGNDGTEVVKEFKSLLVKLSDDGSIKKSDARDILMTLTAMGR